MIFRQSTMHKLQEMCVLKIKNCRYIYIYHVESLVNSAVLLNYARY